MQSGFHGPVSRLVAAAVGGVLAGSFLVVPPVVAAAKPPAPLSSQVEPLGTAGGDARGVPWTQAQPAPVRLPRPVWPAGTARVTLPERDGSAATAARSGSPGSGAAEPHPGATPARVRAGQLPVWLGRAGGTGLDGPDDVTVDVLDRGRVPAAWRDALLVRLRPSDGSPAGGAVDVSLDYRSMRYALGADWSSRLRLWSVPPCALETTVAAGCSPTALRSVNDTATTSVSARVPLGSAALVALAAAPAGPSGDFTATPLAATGSWSAAGSAGAFSWSYPMRVPPAPAGPAPQVALSYSSASVDGRSAATNNQPSWIGEGFDYSPGFIERRYVACLDDEGSGANNSADKGDLCWRSDNAVMTLNGGGSELIFQAGKGWHARSEQGAKIEKLPGASNGDDDGEHWKVTAADGTQYFFGRNSLPGQSAKTESAWTVPVFGNHANEPCHDSSFAESACVQAWRWNLDYVIDPYGNTMSYWYDKEYNQYAANVTSSDNRLYVRGGSLRRIDYGTWDRGASDRSVRPTAQVAFDLGNRCVTTACATHTAANWPDVPWEQECATTATSCGVNYSPTFWTTKRLSTVTTRVWDTSGTTPGWQDVDSWTLEPSFPNPHDGTNAGLWLASIRHKGEVTEATTRPNQSGPAITMPAVTFEPTTLANRVLTKTNTSNNWHRIGNIVTESGAKIQVTYSQAECSSSKTPSDPHTNTLRCYPVLGPRPDDPGRTLTEYWHKYVVEQVSESDIRLSNGHESPVQNTFYTYDKGGPAWHYADDDGFSKPKYKTWNQYRGYATVTTRKGDASGRQTLTVTKYLRGMHGDRLAPAGGTRQVTVAASIGGETVYDEEEFAGMVREETVYNGDISKPVSRTVSVPWQSPATASRTINGDTATARYVGTRITYDATALGVDGARGWRTTRTVSKLNDTYGSVEWTQDDGDIAVTGDETCVAHTYNRNTAKNLLGTVKRTTTTARPCGEAPERPDDIISDVRNYYDGATSPDTAPEKGTVTRVDQLHDWTAAGGTVFQTASRSTPDAAGRIVAAVDKRGNTTRTEYTPKTGGPVTRVTTIAGPQEWKTVEDRSPYWGAATRTTDPNKKVTEAVYDALGRVVQVWNPSWTRAEHPTMPSERYLYWYSPDRSAYPYQKSETLHAGGGYRTVFEIYDAHLRSRQTQRASVAGGGRIVTDTIYDERGQVSATYAPHAETGGPVGTLWFGPAASVPSVTRTEYDNAGRQVEEVLLASEGAESLVEKWRTSTRHEGDLTRVIPPRGGTPTTTVTDIEGRTVELRQHTTPAGVDGAYDTTTYVYNRKGQQTRVVDPAGNEWRYTFDVKGRQVEVRDPDRGRTVSRYNEADDVAETTDAEGRVLSRSYDELGRPTAVYDGTGDAAKKRTEWRYDKLFTQQPVLGQLTESIRYDPPGSANAYTWRVRSFDDTYHPVGFEYVIPPVETGLAGTYPYVNGYSDRDGSPTTMEYPAAADLTGETVTTGYDQATGLASTLTTNRIDTGSYVVSQRYTNFGEPTVTKRQIAGGVYVEDDVDYDPATRRTTRSTVRPEQAAGTVSVRSYTHDPAGNITAISDGPQVGPADSECFRYDALRQLTAAWTPRSGVGCGSAPTLAGLGGPAPYWHDWTFDRSGNRLTETEHAAAGNTTRTSTVPTPGPDSVRPHAVTSIRTEAPGGQPATTGYRYDATGNTTSRPGATGATQTLSWDAEGRLSRSTEAGATSTSVYDVQGERLIHRDPGGSTLYLPGQEIRRSSAGVLTATRYYSFGGREIASRTSGNQTLTWLYTDHQGTQLITVNAYTQAVDVRRQTPYGAPRGTAPNWPTKRGFVGGDIDSTGLTHIGAREYDVGLGSFISVDPIMDLAQPQQWNAYRYSNNSPVTMSDPDGLRPMFTDTSWGDNQLHRRTGQKFVKRNGKWRSPKPRMYVPCRNIWKDCGSKRKPWKPTCIYLVIGSPCKPTLYPQQPKPKPKPKPKFNWPDLSGLAEFLDKYSPKGTSSDCIGGGAAARLMVSVEVCLEWDDRGIGLGGGVKTGTSNGIGFDVSRGMNWSNQRISEKGGCTPFVQVSGGPPLVQGGGTVETIGDGNFQAGMQAGFGFKGSPQTGPVTVANGMSCSDAFYLWKNPLFN